MLKPPALSLLSHMTASNSILLLGQEFQKIMCFFLVFLDDVLASRMISPLQISVFLFSLESTPLPHLQNTGSLPFRILIG